MPGGIFPAGVEANVVGPGLNIRAGFQTLQVIGEVWSARPHRLSSRATARVAPTFLVFQSWVTAHAVRFWSLTHNQQLSFLTIAPVDKNYKNC